MLTEGLAQIHAEGILHHDLHSRNILVAKNLSERSTIYISDLGLSGPANKSLRDGKICGVLPYLAPEVLRGYPYTDKAEIYSLGMLAWEILTGELPFSVCSHDANLARRVCSGERPDIPIEIPEFYKEFICMCWNADPLLRPSAEDLNLAMEEMLYILLTLADIQKTHVDNIEMIPQCQSTPITSTHPDAVYSSRCFTVKDLEIPNGIVALFHLTFQCSHIN